MNYPTLEKFNEALQNPKLSLQDIALKQGVVSQTGLGLPLALCGGFALTYTITAQGKKYALRCFHKKSDSLEQRYRAVSGKISRLNSPYFVEFEFQPSGILVNGQKFPVVKMAWASGETLGEFLESNYKNKVALSELKSSLRKLAIYLESNCLAHGDIQPGNVMVSNGGRKLELIDYDGVFVPELKTLGSAELGHRNFQHPQRNGQFWGSHIDRFSFIALNLSLSALELRGDLWVKTQSDGDSVIFKANDYADAANSTIFSELSTIPQIAQDLKNFEAICSASPAEIPTLEHFLARQNIPKIVVIKSPRRKQDIRYISAFPVLNATNYAQCFKHVGDKVELIGKIVEVKQDKTRYGKPYIFINFGPWKGNIVKITIWSEGLDVLKHRPDSSWVGKWVSVSGLMDPPYQNRKFGYSHLSIGINQSNQISIITEQDALYRLSGSGSTSSSQARRPTNVEVLKRPPTGTGSIHSSPRQQQSKKTQNQDIIAAMNRSKKSSGQSRRSGSNRPISASPPSSPQRASGENYGWVVWVIIAIFLMFVFGR